jgi:hypothetical protein
MVIERLARRRVCHYRPTANGSSRSVGLIAPLISEREDTMVRDLLLLVAVSIVIWSVFGNSPQDPGTREVKHHSP